MLIGSQQPKAARPPRYDGFPSPAVGAVGAGGGQPSEGCQQRWEGRSEGMPLEARGPCSVLLSNMHTSGVTGCSGCRARSQGCLGGQQWGATGCAWHLVKALTVPGDTGQRLFLLPSPPRFEPSSPPPPKLPPPALASSHWNPTNSTGVMGGPVLRWVRGLGKGEGDEGG